MRKMRFFGAHFVLFGILFFGVMGLLIFGLWNALIPAILGLPKISFWQALGLFILSRILFGRFGGGGWGKMRKARFVRGWKIIFVHETDSQQINRANPLPHDCEKSEIASCHS